MSTESLPAAPSTPKGRATRQRLLDVARRLAVATRGGVELAKVADAAGVVPSLVNRYFGSKAGLVSALVDDFFDRFHAEVLDADLDAEGEWARHERIRLERGVRFHYAEPFAAVVYGPLGRDPEVARKESARIAFVVERAARSIRRAQRRGELPVGIDPGLAGAAMFGAMRLVMVEALARSPRPPPERVVEALWRQVAASVGIDPARSHRRKPRD
ncbi:MAG: TetR/AcrR family transcriptional regulator [Myxococcota bacterium]